MKNHFQKPPSLKVAALYSDVFMFGGPRGSQTVKKDDFLKLLPGRKTYFQVNRFGKNDNSVNRGNLFGCQVYFGEGSVENEPQELP